MKRLSLLVTIVLSAACTINTSNSDPAAPGPNGGSTADGGGSTGPDQNSDGTSGGGSAGDVKTGSVIITQSSFKVGTTEINSHTAMASFVEATSGGTATGGANKCAVSTEGDCQVTVCETTSGGQQGGTPPAGEAKKQPSAGDISVKGLQEIVLSPDAAKGTYPAKTGQTALFKGGDELVVKAAGADVPAFEKALKAPSSVTLTAPTWPAMGSAFELDRASDLQLAWDNGTAGEVQAMVAAIGGGKTSSVMCKFKAEAGKGTISKAALGKLVASDQGTISVSAMSSASVEAGGWKISVMATSPASAGSGVASGLAKIK